MKSWFWHGRFEGTNGGYIPPDGLVPHFLYWLGWLCRKREGDLR